MAVKRILTGGAVRYALATYMGVVPACPRSVYEYDD